MKLVDQVLTSAITKKVSDQVWENTDPPNKGIYISHLTGCYRWHWFNINKPYEVKGIKLTYYDSDSEGNGDYIMACGQPIEDIMEEHIKANNVLTFVDKQHSVYDLNKKVRGRIDFAVYHEKYGPIILDAKGMSDRIFTRFKTNIPLKEFNENYYAQVTYYIHILDCNYGAIVGVNRSTGEVAVKSITKKESEDDFYKYRAKCQNIINTTIDNFMDLPVTPEECSDCDYCDICHSLKSVETNKILLKKYCLEETNNGS